jgi:hypothetical protein
MGHFPEGISSLSEASTARDLRLGNAFVDFEDSCHAPLKRDRPGETANYFPRSCSGVNRPSLIGQLDPG